MIKSVSSTYSFRLNVDERNIIEGVKGALSIGEFARRAALNIEVVDRTKEQIALCKIIRAIHLAVGSRLPPEVEKQVRSLLKDALVVVSNTSLRGADAPIEPTLDDRS